LIPNLKKEEFWDNPILDELDFENEFYEIEKQFNLTVDYAMDLYDILGGDNISLINLKNNSEEKKNNKIKGIRDNIKYKKNITKKKREKA